MTVDKFIAVCFPLKASRWCTKTRAKISAVLIVLSIAALNAPNLLTEPDIENIKLRLGKKTCAYKREFVAAWYPEIIDILFATLSLGLPLLIVVVLNLAIVSRVSTQTIQTFRINILKVLSCFMFMSVLLSVYMYNVILFRMRYQYNMLYFHHVFSNPPDFNSFNPSILIFDFWQCQSAKLDNIFWKKIGRNIVQMVNMNNFSSNTFSST
jgi:hypothetical protein